MKKLLILALVSLLVSCNIKMNLRHRHTIISNNYKDTFAIWADSFQYHNEGYATFYAEGGKLTIRNINKIIIQ